MRFPSARLFATLLVLGIGGTCTHAAGVDCQVVDNNGKASNSQNIDWENVGMTALSTGVELMGFVPALKNARALFKTGMAIWKGVEAGKQEKDPIEALFEEVKKLIQYSKVDVFKVSLQAQYSNAEKSFSIYNATEYASQDSCTWISIHIDNVNSITSYFESLLDEANGGIDADLAAQTLITQLLAAAHVTLSAYNEWYFHSVFEENGNHLGYAYHKCKTDSGFIRAQMMAVYDYYKSTLEDWMPRWHIWRIGQVKSPKSQFYDCVRDEVTGMTCCPFELSADNYWQGTQEAIQNDVTADMLAYMHSMTVLHQYIPGKEDLGNIYPFGGVAPILRRYTSGIKKGPYRPFQDYTASSIETVRPLMGYKKNSWASGKDDQFCDYPSTLKSYNIEGVTIDFGERNGRKGISKLSTSYSNEYVVSHDSCAFSPQKFDATTEQEFFVPQTDWSISREETSYVQKMYFLSSEEKLDSCFNGIGFATNTTLGNYQETGIATGSTWENIEDFVHEVSIHPEFAMVRNGAYYAGSNNCKFMMAGSTSYWVPAPFLDSILLKSPFERLPYRMKEYFVIANYEHILSGNGNNVTALVPTSEAFQWLPYTAHNFLRDPNNEEILKSFLLHHLVSGSQHSYKFQANGITEVKTLAGTVLKVSTNGDRLYAEYPMMNPTSLFMFGSANAVTVDIAVSYGVIHYVDNFLIHDSFVGIIDGITESNWDPPHSSRRFLRGSSWLLFSRLMKKKPTQKRKLAPPPSLWLGQ